MPLPTSPTNGLHLRIEEWRPKDNGRPNLMAGDPETIEVALHTIPRIGEQIQILDGQLLVHDVIHVPLEKDSTVVAILVTTRV